MLAVFAFCLEEATRDSDAWVGNMGLLWPTSVYTNKHHYFKIIIFHFFFF